jgi:hypothetical protein
MEDVSLLCRKFLLSSSNFSNLGQESQHFGNTLHLFSFYALGGPKRSIMDELKLTGRNLGRVFNSELRRVFTCPAIAHVRLGKTNIIAFMCSTLG